MNRQKVMKLEEYEHRLEKLKIKANSPYADALTRSDTNEELEFNRYVEKMGEFFHTSTYL